MRSACILDLHRCLQKSESTHTTLSVKFTEIFLSLEQSAHALQKTQPNLVRRPRNNLAHLPRCHEKSYR